jgi:hypothetical protein
MLCAAASCARDPGDVGEKFLSRYLERPRCVVFRCTTSFLGSRAKQSLKAPPTRVTSSKCEVAMPVGNQRSWTVGPIKSPCLLDVHRGSIKLRLGSGEQLCSL